MRKLTLLLLGVLLFASTSWAQRTITGTVTDDKGNPVPNVSVLVKGTTKGTTTKMDGTYSLTVPGTAKTLTFSAVNMVAFEAPIGSQAVINASLKTEEQSLTEVVVTGYTREKKREFTGAASVMSSKVIE